MCCVELCEVIILTFVTINVSGIFTIGLFQVLILLLQFRNLIVFIRRFLFQIGDAVIEGLDLFFGKRYLTILSTSTPSIFKIGIDF